MGVHLGDLRSIRKALGKSQSKMAALLGVSTRAIQSYEQGWRTPPAATLKLAAYMLYLKRRKSVPGSPAPCWQVKKCPPEIRAECFAFQSGEGQCCWLITGNACQGRKLESWQAKLDRCTACEVVRRWLEDRPVADRAAKTTFPSPPADGPPPPTLPTA